VEVAARTDVAMFFAGMLGFKSMALEARAVARAGAVEGSCLLVLDPEVPRALRLDSNARVTAPDCDVVVNSTDSRAIEARGNSLVRAAAIRVAGGSTARTDTSTRNR